MFATVVSLALAAAQPVSAAEQGTPIGIVNLPPVAPGQSPPGVISYPAAFFAAAQPNTAADMVARLPGFVFDPGDSVRGFAGAAGNVLIDGARPTSKTDDLDSILRRIPASLVDHIDLIRGGAPGIDMQGKTVIANVVRKTGPSTTGVFSLSDDWASSQGRHAPGLRLEWTRQKGGVSMEGSVTAGAFIDDGAGVGPEVATAPNGTPISTQHDDTKGGGFQIATTGAVTAPIFGGQFRANTQLSLQEYTFRERDQDVSSLALQPTLDHQHQNREQGELGLTFDRAFSPKLTTETLFIQQIQGEDYLEPFSQIGETDRYREQHSNGESILRATATYTGSDSLTLSAGAEGDYNWLNSHTTYVSNGAVVALPAANVQVTEARGEAFVKGAWVINPQFTLEAGLRIEASKIASAGDVVFNKTLTYPKPRVVLTWSPDAADQFRFRVEEEVGQLDFNNFIAVTSLTTGQIFTGNPNLSPQQALVYEAAYEHRFWKSGDMTFTYRHSNLTDVVDRAPVVTPSGDYDDPANIGGGVKDEYIAALNVPIDRLGIPGGLIKANVTWRSSRVTDPTTGQPRALGNLRPREGEIDFSQDLPRWKLTWGATYNLGWSQAYYSYDEVEVDQFRQFVTAFAEYRPKPDLAVRLEIYDIGADYRRTLEVYPDLRSLTPLEEIDIRSLYFGPSLHFRVRKTF
jgi:hypothetical protein